MIHTHKGMIDWLPWMEVTHDTIFKCLDEHFLNVEIRKSNPASNGCIVRAQAKEHLLRRDKGICFRIPTSDYSRDIVLEMIPIREQIDSPRSKTLLLL